MRKPSSNVDFPIDAQKLREVFEYLEKTLGSTAEAVNFLENTLQSFYKIIADDLLIGFFFNSKDLALIAKRQSEFLLRGMGVHKSYLGQPPTKAHQNLAPILSGHFDRRLTLLKAHLESLNIPSQYIESWLGFENAFRTTILSREINLANRTPKS